MAGIILTVSYGSFAEVDLEIRNEIKNEIKMELDREKSCDRYESSECEVNYERNSLLQHQQECARSQSC